MRNLILSTLLTLALLIYSLSLLAQNSFSLSQDVDGRAGDQAVTSLNVSANETVAIQIDMSNAELSFTPVSVCPGDFDNNGIVGFPDFLLFVGVFGTYSGDANYNALMDMDDNDVIGFPDFLLFVGVFGTTCDPALPGTGVSIPDANLRAIIEDKLGKASGAPITSSEMASLTRLEAFYSGISDLTGLEFATNLTSLNFSSNNITDLSSLSDLTNLTTLSLHFNSISDVSPLSGLTNLTRLNLQGNSISDVSSLSGLTNLTSLRLQFNSISDVSPLSGLTNLTRLNLQGNSISDVSPLSGLTNLTYLNLSNNRVVDISSLSNLTNLTWLDLSTNDISDVSVLSGLTNPTRLYLSRNSISDLSPLVANGDLGSGDEVEVRRNPLSAISLNTHIPALEARGVRVDIVVFNNPQIYNDNVFVLPVTENFAVDPFDLPLRDYAVRFYEYFSDAFDFLIFFPSLIRSDLDSKAFKGAYYQRVSNDVRGIGMDIFFQDQWGSGKLQGGLFFSYVSGRSPKHSGLVVGPMLHELMHRWANYIVSPTPHWNFTSAAGILGGFDIANLVDHGAGHYSAPGVSTGGQATNTKRYSPIELYLAGLIPPEEVPDLWVAEDGERLLEASGRWDRKSFTANRVKTSMIDDIIAEHGPRVPDHSQSQRAFRAAVILLVNEDYPATRKFLEVLSNDASLFSHAGEDQHDGWYNFYEATGGRATITMGGLSQFRSRGASKRPVARSFGTPPPPIVCHWH